jgi:hypothetical protein
MEEAVNTEELVAWALGEAGTLGAEFEPTDLLTTVSKDADPLTALGTEQANAYFECASETFGFLDAHRTTKKPPTPDEKVRLVGLMRWLVRQLTAWRSADDPKRHRLAAFMVLARYCELNGAFWQNIPNSAGLNVELMRELSGRLAGLKVDIASDGRSSRPISDKEVVEGFRKADAEGKWVELAARWHQLGGLMPGNVLVSQAVKCLQRFDPNELAKAVSGMRGTVLTMQVVAPLTIAEGLALAIESRNPYVEFAAALRALPPKPSAEATEPTVQQLVAQLLCAVAGDGARWAQWMDGFNRYPLRYPTLQSPLGIALAAVPEVALEAYVDSIALNTGAGEDRKLVAECLRAFHSSASAVRREKLWRLAHKRWSNWNFGRGDPAHKLTQIGYSQLDYAIVGYAVECLDPVERAEIDRRLMGELSSLPDKWHASYVDFVSESFRLLSLRQPYAHAAIIKPGDDWLRAGSYLLPFDPKIRRYEAMQYGLSAR